MVVLIRASDPVAQRQLARTIARERLQRERVTPSKEDLSTAFVQTSQVAYEICERINTWLRQQRTAYGLAWKGRLVMNPREGIEAKPLFAYLFEPFLDHLCDTHPHFHLAVCRQCSSIYIRKQKDTRGRYCDAWCAAEARRFRSAKDA
jgi:hypothetical protein